MSGNLKHLVASRGNFRGQVNSIFEIKDSLPQKSSEEKECLRRKLNRIQEELNKLDPSIRTLKWECYSDEKVKETENNKEIESSGLYLDKITECLVKLSPAPSDTTNAGSSSGTLSSLLKSPTIPLPKFNSRDGEDLTHFFRQFEETIARFNYSDYDKFLLLKQQITGRASVLLTTLDTAYHSYDRAKALLNEALASPATRKFNAVKQMSSLKLDFYGEPFEYIGQLNSIQTAFEELKITTTDILQYFAWNGLNEAFKNQIVQITNETKPSLKQIKEKFFEATERYNNYRKCRNSMQKNKEILPAKSTSLAMAVEFEKKSAPNAFQSCPLCLPKDSSHPIHKCPRYPDPWSKVEKLKNLKSCIKCARMDHVSDKCRFHFKNRCNCGDWHFTFLCLAKKDKKEKESKVERSGSSVKGKIGESAQKKSETESKLSCIEVFDEAYEARDSSNTVLPTFSALLNGKNIRCMRDNCCQSNFIIESRAKAENLTVVKNNFILRVNGFNTSKDYVTNIYKVTLKIAEESYEIEAIGIPSIRTSMNLPGLKTVVVGFTERGYTLADKFLLDGEENICDIEFVLGSTSAYCLRENGILFGDVAQGVPSLYSETPAGVMLIGDVENQIANLKYLPHNVCNFTANCKIENSEISSITCEDVGLSQISYALSDYICKETESNFAVIKENGEINDSELMKATNEMLESICYDTLKYDKVIFPDDYAESSEKIINYVLNNTIRNEEGRLIMPLVWNNKVNHLLGRNKNLAVKVLKSNFCKLSKNKQYLKMVDDTFKEQNSLGIIEKIENIDQFEIENPNCSYLSHMAVFKPERESTKCRVVFLSNLCEKDPTKGVTLSHNQAMLSGPSINQKITSALLHLRFDLYLLCFDIKKAFLNIALSEVDANKLLFLWYRNVDKGDFSLIGYRSIRLPFGLVCSPCLLLLALYKILILDVDEDSERMKKLKKQIYSLIYMDNGSITSMNREELKWSYDKLRSIFEPYCFSLQQFVTNDENIQREIDKGSIEQKVDSVKLLGLQWERVKDEISTKPLNLDNKANTKRTVLKTIAAHFDIFGFTSPILNRARLFLHTLQCDKSLNWDAKLSEEFLNNWRNICKQVNSSPNIKINRFIGPREGIYRLIAFTDSSKDIYGTTVYIQNVQSLEVSFLIGKNRIVNRQLSTKGIPSLEFQAITLGTEILIDLYKELAGPSCVCPIKIINLSLYSDSLVSLAWINSHVHKLDKTNKKSIFIVNRLEHISRLCEVHPIDFKFVSGVENPADQITRPVSYKLLARSNYFCGPSFLQEKVNSFSSESDLLCITVPNPFAKSSDIMPVDIEVKNVSCMAGGEDLGHIAPLGMCSGFFRLVRCRVHILRFVVALKRKLFKKYPDRYAHLNVEKENLYEKAVRNLIRTEQRIKFAEIFSYFENSRKCVKNIPNIVNQLNIYPDRHGLLRVRSKFARWQHDETLNFQVLLPKDSDLTRMIVTDMHERLSHAGVYRLLSELRKQFWIPQYFSVVKRILKSCVTCRKINQRTIKVNQSSYREFRVNPPEIPFSYIFIDHIGPYYMKINGLKKKVWILCISCLWSRAINLKICHDLSTDEFLRNFQLHCFQYGVPQLCLSDLGSSFVAGSNILKDHLNDMDVKKYFEEHGVKPLTFEQYAKGHHPLGGLVECCVKLVRNMIRSSIKNYVLEWSDFEFIIAQTTHLVNRRPIAFQEGLRETNTEDLPEPITPEKLIHGYELVSLNLIPGIQEDLACDPDWLPNTDPIDNAKSAFSKLKIARSRLLEAYQSEFQGQLIKQAVNRKDRYRPVTHTKLQVGDIVLMKEENCKPIDFPMAVVRDTKENCNGEVTEVTLLKGRTREIVRRHVTSLIPILCDTEAKNLEDCPTKKEDKIKNPDDCKVDNNENRQDKPKRLAAVISEQKTRNILKD